MPKVTIQKISFAGWDNCVQISNGIVDLIVTADVGPRIIRYGFIGKENELCVVASTKGMTGGDEWRIYGGHRLWHSPEDRVRTYQPDNKPVAWKEIKDGIKVSQDVERLTGIKKEMEITLSADSTEVHLLHRLINKGSANVVFSVWSLTAMATGGKEIVPVTGHDTGLLPNRTISLWPYTKLNDPRLTLGEKYIIIHQDAAIKEPLKFGIPNENGWAAYFNHNNLFIKYHEHQADALYPDFGVSYETYTNDFMLEMETLSPLTILESGKAVEHAERWELFSNVPAPSNNETEIENILSDRLRTR
ncbi:MAG: DUF4380 domain-containing protein [Nitrospirae bacterium]|nr:DUF4380 domain-containing protein [Nitrospirota bacterium]